jgi:hypothetical protein
VAAVLAWFVALGGHLLAQWAALPGYPVGSRTGYLAGLAVACVAVVLFVVLAGRHRRLRRALRLVLTAQTSQLRSAAVGSLVELAVRVADASPIVRGPLTGLAHAWTGLTATRVYRSGKNHGAEMTDLGRGPTRLLVVDDSGAGELDVSRVVLDVRAERHVLRRVEVARDPAARLLAGLLQSDYSSFELEEQMIDQGEALYALGEVQQCKAADPGLGRAGARPVPIVGGTPGRPLILYAGGERSLLGQLGRERLALDLALGAYGLLTCALLGLMLVAAIAW